MRKIGAHVSSSGGITNAVTNILNIGGNCMQIFAGSPRMWRRSLYKPADVTKFRQLVKEHNLDPVYIHALYLTNLASDNSELREKSRNALVTDLTNSAAIKSEGVILHIGSHQGRGFDVVKDLVVSQINQVLAATPKTSTLILENSAGQKGKIGSLVELNYLLSQLNNNRVKICLDSAHAFEAGFALNNPQGIKLFVKEIEKHLRLENVVALHINDSRTPMGSGRDIHENLGEGHIGKSGIKNLINHPKLSHLPLILEVPGFDRKGPDAKNMTVLKSLLQ